MEATNRIGVIYNPHSGFDNSRKRWTLIRKYMEKKGMQYDFLQSETPDSVERLAKMMCENGYHVIVVVGGDGSLNRAVNAVMQCRESLPDDFALANIPNGIANDFSRFWGVSVDDYKLAVDGIIAHHVRKIDVGCCTYQDDHIPQRRYFLNCINIGLVATIMNLRRETRHLLGSRTLSFLFSFILLIFQRLEYKMHIKINTDEIKRKVMTVCIGNARGYGQTPNANPYNGLLDVSVVYHPEMTQLFEGIYLFVRGKFLNHRSVHPYRTRQVEIEEAQKALVGIDGRLMNSPVGKYTITVEQEVINFLIPA